MSQLRMVTILMLLILLASSCGLWQGSGKVVATVGEKQITRGDVRWMMEGMKRRQDLDSSQLFQEALKQLIAQELLYREAVKRGIKISDEEISGQLDLLRREFLSWGSFADLLKEKDMNNQSLSDHMRRELMIARLLDEEVVAKTAIGETDLVKRPQEVHQRYIFRRIFPGAPKTKRQEAWDKMEEALKKLEAGEDFPQVAQEYSQSGLAKFGGDAGFVTLNPYSKTSRALFELKEGHISEIMETRWGLYIFQAQEIRPEMMQAYAELNPKLQRIVLQQRMQERLDEFVEELRREADVEMTS